MLLLNRASNNFVDSLSHAADQGVWIINASYSYTIHDARGNVIGYAPLNTSHTAAIWNYGELGGLLICAAGNGIGGVAQNTDTTPMYPASYSTYTIPRKTFLGVEIQPARPITNVISVGSIDNGGARSSFSNFGSTSVQIFAPGRNILSIFPTTRWGTTVAGYAQIAEGYARTQGTSMAAPHVTGVAALIRSINQDLTAVQVKNAILDNVSYSIDASGNNRLSGLCSSQGMLNAHQALASVALMHTPSGNNASITGIANEINLTGTLVIPESINKGTVSQIGSSAFSGQTQLTQITIPSTVTHVGNDAFKNTNNVPIYLEGKTVVPSTYNVNWNSSGNPVYLNGNLCTHPSTTLTSSNHTQHGQLCDECRTFVSKTNHNHTHSYIPYGTAPSGVAVHLSVCKCDDSVVTPCVSRFPHEPGDTVMCWYCGQIFSNPIMYTITLTNGEVFVSNVPFTFEMYKALSSDLGLVYSYNTYLLESAQSQILNLESHYKKTTLLPYNIQNHDHGCNYCSNDCLACDKDYYDCFDSDFVPYIDRKELLFIIETKKAYELDW